MLGSKASKEELQTASEDDSSSASSMQASPNESRIPTPEPQKKELTMAEKMAVTSISHDLRGWLRKKHHKSGEHWADRYFSADDSRGLLLMSK